MDISQGKVFYKPEPGMYNGTVIDVVEFPKRPTKYGLKDKVLIVWALNNVSNAPVGQTPVGPDGEPMYASAYVTATISDKSSQPLFRNLYKLVYGILGGQPPLITSTAQLEGLLMGRSNSIMLTKEPNTEKQGEFYSNIVSISPFPQGAPVPVTPQSFKRAKDRAKQQAGPDGQPVNTYSQPPAQPVAAQPVYVAPAAVAPVAAPVAAYVPPTAPTPEQIAAFLATQAKPVNPSF